MPYVHLTPSNSAPKLVVVRSVTASVLLCFCALSFLQAPAAHTHALVSDDDHHNFELAHLHAATHPATPSNGPELHSPDPASDMRSVDWFLSANLSSPEPDTEV